jgi:hypothetical protein
MRMEVRHAAVQEELFWYQVPHTPPPRNYSSAKESAQKLFGIKSRLCLKPALDEIW